MSIIPNTLNPDLQKERNASFNVEEFALWWHGGADKLKFKRELEQCLYSDLKETHASIQYKSHEEIYTIGVKHSLQVARKLREMQQMRNPGGSDIWPAVYTEPVSWGAIPGGNAFGVHFMMMVKALKNQSTDEQYEEFGKRAENFEICGTYAQTELGHGTFLRGLETRADYDRSTQEFILNTPTLTSYKWWPGGLGHSSNYCIVVAQLYIDGKAKGVEMFFVQVRDEKTHRPLPGIDIGEIGKKIGFFAVNNGYLGLKNVRIPRTRMLMRNAQVLPDGTYIKSPASVLIYFTMVFVRCTIVRNNTFMLAAAATIATRYSAVRRQSPINPNEREPQVIDHVTQQLKLFPEIANAIAYHLAARSLWSMYDQTYVDIGRGDYARLPELHTLACAMKVLCSADSSAGIERLRLACGGHGYLTAANFGTIYSNATAACTYEGENTVLLLQVGRFLIKAWRSALEGKILTPTVKYLSEAVNKTQFDKWTGSWQNIVEAMEFIAANKTRLAFASLSRRLKDGQTEPEAANNTGIEFTQAAELHGRAFVCSTFLAAVYKDESKTISASLKNVLENLLELFLVQTALRHMGDLLRFIGLAEADLVSLQSRLEEVLRKLRPDVVGICDGFDFHDNSLGSILGCYDGNVYERIFESAKQSPMNQEQVPRAFHEYLQPILKSNM